MYYPLVRATRIVPGKSNDVRVTRVEFVALPNGRKRRTFPTAP